MGRITIFTVSNCSHCRRVKAAFDIRQAIPYTEINLSLYPTARVHMLQLTDRLTEPQVFFNDRHVGGAEETLILLETSVDWKDASSARAMYERDIASQPDPTDLRLQLPTDVSTALPVPLESTPPMRDACIRLPHTKEKVTVLEMTRTLQRIFPCDQTIQSHWIRYKRSFTGRQALIALQTHFAPMENETTALDKVPILIRYGQYLVSQQLLHRCDSGRKSDNDGDIGLFEDSTESVYRLQCHDTPAVLNSFRIWMERNDATSDTLLILVRRLQTMLSNLVQQCTDSTTGLVNYKMAAHSVDFDILDEAVCELQAVDLFTMDIPTRSAVCINVYNLMVEFAFIKVGVGTTSANRGLFFRSVSVSMSGHLFSLNDLEHGILRGNRPPPYSFSIPFGPKDPRLALAVPVLDCRIHFALNCGAKSCPPVQNFTALDLEEELRIVALSFCEQDDNVRLIHSESNKSTDTKMTLFLSTILYWYQGDFAPTRTQLPTTVVQFLRGEKRQLLESATHTNRNGTVHVKFLAYDWTTKASDFICFDRSAVEANETTLWRYFFP